MDKRLSLREFQLYSYKNREMFSCLDKFEKLITRNPIGPPSTFDRPRQKQSNILEEEAEDSENYDKENEREEEEEGGDDYVNIGEEDPDLLMELNLNII